MRPADLTDAEVSRSVDARQRTLLSTRDDVVGRRSVLDRICDGYALSDSY